jgi:hypothetical protein
MPTLSGRRASRQRLAGLGAGVLTSTWALGLIVFILTWGGGAVAPYPWSLDVSTYAGLSLATQQGLDFGGDIVFTYGPLGFLKTGLVFYPWLARLAALYAVLLHLCLSLTLIYAARRSFPLPVALAASLVAAVLIRGDVAAEAVRADAAVVVLAFIWCVVTLSSRSPEWPRRLVIIAGGPVAAIEILAKLNIGLIVLALVVVTALVLEEERRRNLTILACGFGTTLVGLWFLTGQGLGDIAPYIRGSVQIISSYSTGARLEYGTRDYDYVVAPAVILIVAGVAWVATRWLPSARRAAILAMLALVAFTSLKSGLISHEVFHMATFYATMLGAALAFELPARLGAQVAGAAAVAAIAAAGFTTSYDGYPLTDPVENVRNGGSTVLDVVVPGRLEDEIAATRASLVSAYGLDDESLALLRQQRVHVEPSEVTAAWAYELDWSPLPIYQSYVASWQPSLDERNAEAMASDDGPNRILRQSSNPLGRYPGFDSPAAAIQMLCHFTPLRTTDSWQVLGRVSDRCGQARAIGSASAAYGEPVPVPRAGPDEVVFARVHGVQVSGLERLEALLYRADGRRVAFDDGSNFVFIPGTAADGLLLRAPKRVDFPGAYALAPDSETVTFIHESGDAGELTADFYAMPVRPAPAEGPAARGIIAG